MATANAHEIHWHRYSDGHRADYAGRLFRIHNTRAGMFPFTISIGEQIGDTQEYTWTEVDAHTTFRAAKESVADWEVAA